MHFNSLVFEYAEKGKLLSMCQCVCQCVCAYVCACEYALQIAPLSRGGMVTDQLLCVLMNWGSSY